MPIRCEGKQALATALFARTEVLGFERKEHELTPDATELGLAVALPAVFEMVPRKIGEYGRGDRGCPLLSSRCADLPVDQLHPTRDPAPVRGEVRVSELATPRQLEVLRARCEAGSRKEAAALLGIRP
jgi:hypothetical protein